MNDQELQKRLVSFQIFPGPVTGVIDAATLTAINAFLNFGNIKVPSNWSTARRTLAAKQLVCQKDGIDAGTIDGQMGPQTQFAFDVYAEAQGGGPIASIPDRDTAPARAAPRGIPPIWPRQADVPSFYGAVGANQAKLILPYRMKLAWDKSKPVTSFSIHQKVHDSALRCLTKIATIYDEQARADLGIDLFGGCLNVRKMRGGSNWSMHSWGIGIDFDPERNALKANRKTARLARPDAEPFWQVWEAEGWVSLGRARDFDWMHVQAARL